MFLACEPEGIQVQSARFAANERSSGVIDYGLSYVLECADSKSCAPLVPDVVGLLRITGVALKLVHATGLGYAAHRRYVEVDDSRADASREVGRVGAYEVKRLSIDLENPLQHQTNARLLFY